MNEYGNSELTSTGIPGLDFILRGGLPSTHLYLVEGTPGTGKTSLGLQFLMEGVKRGETGLYVSLSETKREIEKIAVSHGWTLEGVEIFELHAPEESIKPQGTYTMFHPSEVEYSQVFDNVLELVRRLKPLRVVFDSLSEMRLIARDTLRYRRQILALKQFFAGSHATVILLEDKTGDKISEHQLQSLAHGVIALEQFTMQYGAKRRRLSVVKLRGVDFHGGYHDFNIKRGGLVVYPRLVAASHHRTFPTDTLQSGIAALDRLLGGGLDRGSSNLIIGPAGTGKTSIAMRYAAAAVAQGYKASIFMFDEITRTLISRCERLNMPIRQFIDEGLLNVRQIDPAELPPGEFVHSVRAAVEHEGVQVVVIDSLNGYLNAMPEEHYLLAQMHELLSYLNQMGVLTFLVVSQAGVLGQTLETPVDVSYLADTTILLRYFEHQGRVRKAISVVKKRSGPHEESIRELQLHETGIRLGEPLHAFQGVLTGQPRYVGESNPLLGGDGAAVTI